MGCETVDFKCFFKKTSNIVMSVLRNLKFDGTIIPAPFKLVKLFETEDVNLVDSTIVTDEVATRNNDTVPEPFDVELQPGDAHSLLALDINTIGANEVIGNNILMKKLYATTIITTKKQQKKIAVKYTE
ncbi:hypothetical protein KQX54_004675 [Cotesia glomerata]|uniref:Uncharacterized protein n=1 Tax=Cotesia glomerata TaxID=32391 RepID=A0AAV7HBK4_COTGL|nr:hypothetical protein KQX54_004675 [Cotesia glomerata]